MSVICFERKEIAEIISAVRMYSGTHNMNKLYHMPYAERQEIADYYDDNEQKAIDSKIKYLLTRVWCANQMAYTFMYSHHEDFDYKIETTISEKEIRDAETINQIDLYRKLSSLEYNLITNGGNSFINQKDLEAFQDIINSISKIYMREELNKREKQLEALEIRNAELKELCKN